MVARRAGADEHCRVLGGAGRTQGSTPSALKGLDDERSRMNKEV
jgi:hypothetical protein